MKMYSCRHVTCNNHWDNVIGTDSFYHPSKLCLGCKNLREYEYEPGIIVGKSFYESKGVSVDG